MRFGSIRFGLRSRADLLNDFMTIPPCSNPELRIPKKIEEKSEAVVRMPMARALKPATT